MQGVLIADYDPAWPSLFEELRERVGNTLGPIVITIEHVGSTSVPNLPAKPIIDLDVVVRPARKMFRQRLQPWNSLATSTRAT